MTDLRTEIVRSFNDLRANIAYKLVLLAARIYPPLLSEVTDATIQALVDCEP